MAKSAIILVSPSLYAEAPEFFISAANRSHSNNVAEKGHAVWAFHCGLWLAIEMVTPKRRGSFLLPKGMIMAKWGIADYACNSCGRKVTGYPGRKEPVYCKPCQRKREKEMKGRRSGTESLKKTMIEGYGQVCQKCGQAGDVMLHHITPINQGGLTIPENCILLCQSCHKDEHEGRGVGPATYNY